MFTVAYPTIASRTTTYHATIGTHLRPEASNAQVPDWQGEIIFSNQRDGTAKHCYFESLCSYLFFFFGGVVTSHYKNKQAHTDDAI